MKKLISIIFILIAFTSSAYAENPQVDFSGKVYMEGEFLNNDLLKISVRADEIDEEVLGIAFNLIYEKEKLQFVRYLPGEFLELGGDPFYLVKDTDGKIVFGETLRRSDYFPAGSGEIAAFYLQIKDGEEFAFSFEKGTLSTFNEVRQDLINIFWEPYHIGEKDELIFSTKTSVPDSTEGSDFTLLIRIGIFALSGVFGIFVFLFIKKRQNKRLQSCVNFNSKILD